MRKITVFILFLGLLASCGASKSALPKKFIGEYEGIQEEYTVFLEEGEIDVPAADYHVVLRDGELTLKSELQTLRASYTLKADTKMYYSFTVHLENGVIEEWQLWKKGKRLIRKPSQPQPELILLKR